MRDRLKALKLKEDGQVLVGGKEDIHQFQRGYVFPTFCFQHVRLSWSRLLWFFFVLVLHLKMFYYANFCSFITQIHHWHSNLLVQQNFEPETTNIHWSLMNFFFGETTAFFFLPLFLYNLDSSSFGKPDLRRLHQPDDLVSVSTENAKNLALSAMWCALPSSRNTRCAGGGMVVRWRTHPHTISL